MSASPGQRKATADRRAKAVRLRLAGVPLTSIATDLGYASPAAAAKDIQRALVERRDLEASQRDLLVVMEAERLDVVERAMSGILAQARQPGGDHREAFKAADTLLKVQQRRAALLGLDARPADDPAPGQPGELAVKRDELAQRRLRKRGIPGG